MAYEANVLSSKTSAQVSPCVVVHTASPNEGRGPCIAALLQIMCAKGCLGRAALAACMLTMKMVGSQQAPL